MKLPSHRPKQSGRSLVLLLVIALVLLFPLRGEAYAGPGAGFAVLSSFWTIFVAFLYSFYALITWPIRHLLRMFRRRKAYGKAQVKRVVIVGFDGMDPELANRFMGEGKLPNLAKLRDHGTFRPRDFSGRVVHVSDRRQSRQTQYLRFSGPRFEKLSPLPFFSADQRAQAPPAHRQVLAAAR